MALRPSLPTPTAGLTPDAYLAVNQAMGIQGMPKVQVPDAAVSAAFPAPPPPAPPPPPTGNNMLPGMNQGPVIDQGFLMPSRAAQQAQVEQQIRAEKATAAAEQQAKAAEAARQGLPGVAVTARGPQVPTGPMTSTPYTPAHFEQAGNYYRGTPEQGEAIKEILGANASQMQTQQGLSAQQMQAERKLAAAQDIEASKAMRANREQAVVEQLQAADREEANRAVREAIDTHAKMAAPDPAEYWRGLGFGGSIMMILADAMDRLGSGMKRERPSNLIEKGIERSLQTQQAHIDKAKGDISQAQGLYAQMRQAGLDQQTAFQAAKARRLEDAAGIIDSYQRQVKLPQMQAALANQADELRKKSAAEYLQLSESIAGQGKGRMIAASGGGPAVPDIKARLAMAGLRKAEAEASEAERKASGDQSDLSFNERHKLQKELTELEISAEKIDKAKANLPTRAQVLGDELSEYAIMPTWFPRSSAEQIAKKEETKMAIGALEPGTKTELDMARYAKQAGHTGSDTYTQEQAARLHDEMKQRILNRAAAVRAALGLGEVTRTETRKRQELTRDALRGK